MLPDGVLSTTPQPFVFSGGRSLSVSKVVDYEIGGIALNDASEGMLYQRWRCQLIRGQVIVDAPSVSPFVLMENEDIEEVSITFDQNMRIALAYVEAGTAKLYWYDSTIPGYDTITLPAGSITPRISLDDKRSLQTGNSDIILAYVRSGSLYYRQQRDRFLIEYELATGITTGLVKIGMNNRWRFQFMLELP